MRLSNLPSLGLASVLFNALQSNAHKPTLLRGGQLPIPEAPSTEKLVGTNWQLKEIGGVPAIPDSQELFFKTEAELSGYDGCNGFRGEWDTVENDQDSKNSDRPSITIDILATNRRMCRLTAEAGEQKSNFMGALRQEAISFSFSADEKELTLYHTLDGNDVPIVMSRIPSPVQPDERLIGTDWVATGIVYPDSQNEEQLRPVLEDHPVTLSFSKDQINGSTGTNEFFGDIPTMTSMEFQVTNVGQTLMGWGEIDDPRKLQENAWMIILTTVNDETESPPEVVTLPYTLFDERIGDTDEWTKVLVLGSFQAPLARFVPLKDGMLDEWGKPIKQIESPLTHENPLNGNELQDTPAIKDLYFDTFQLAGSNWRASNIRGALLRSDTDVTMFFKSKTSVEGSGGCNQFDASLDKLGTLIQINGTEQPLILEHMRVEDLVPTKRYCDGMMAQVENYFFRGLSQESLFYEFDGEELTLWDAVMGEHGRQTRGMFIGRFNNVPVPSWGGQSLVGMTGDEAKAVIEDINPSLQVQIIPAGWSTTADYRLDSVRIRLGEDGNVNREPQRG
eukprot:scaffold832_cov75-Skeletonema_dohrnii-CCMP3373.AAC.14